MTRQGDGAQDWSITFWSGRRESHRVRATDFLKPGLSVEQLAQAARMRLPITPSVVGDAIDLLLDGSGDQNVLDDPERAYAVAEVAAAVVSWCGTDAVSPKIFTRLHNAIAKNNWGWRGPLNSRTPNKELTLGNRAMSTLALAFGYADLANPRIALETKRRAVERWDQLAKGYEATARVWCSKVLVFLDEVITVPLARALSNTPRLLQGISSLHLTPSLHIPARHDGQPMPPPNDAWDLPFSRMGGVAIGPGAYRSDRSFYAVSLEGLPMGNHGTTWSMEIETERGISLEAKVEEHEIPSRVESSAVVEAGTKRGHLRSLPMPA